MKHGKVPNRRQREFLVSKRLNYKNWLIVKDTPDHMDIIKRDFGKIGRVRRIAKSRI